MNYFLLLKIHLAHFHKWLKHMTRGIRRNLEEINWIIRYNQDIFKGNLPLISSRANADNSSFGCSSPFSGSSSPNSLSSASFRLARRSLRKKGFADSSCVLFDLLLAVKSVLDFFGY